MSPAQGGSIPGIVSSDDVCLLSLSIVSALKPKVRGHADAGGGSCVSCHHVRSPPRAPGPRVCWPPPVDVPARTFHAQGWGVPRRRVQARGSRQVARASDVTARQTSPP